MNKILVYYFFRIVGKYVKSLIIIKKLFNAVLGAKKMT